MKASEVQTWLDMARSGLSLKFKLRSSECLAKLEEIRFQRLELPSTLSLYQRESQVRPNSICILKRDKIEMLLFAILESFESNHSIASLDWIAPSDDGTGVQMQIQSDSKSVQMATGFDLTFWHYKLF